jgi:hypothetical protein
MSSEAFIELCRQQLDQDDFQALERGSGAAFWTAFQAWDETLRLNLARYRAQKLGREGAAQMEAPPDPAEAAAAAKTALSFESPLEAELFLDQSRWNAVEALQGLDYFHVNTVFGYLVKLRLMERRAKFTVDAGFGAYKNLYNDIIGTYGEYR